MTCKINMHARMMMCKGIYAVRKNRAILSGLIIVHMKNNVRLGREKCMCMFKACSVSPCNVCNNVASWIKVDVKNSAF